MTIKVTQKTETEVDITLPFFTLSKNKTEGLAILNEKTVVRFSITNTYKNITNTEPWVCENQIADAWYSFDHISETEFLEAFDKAVESISLHPILIP